jgi:hypothetical protein
MGEWVNREWVNRELLPDADVAKCIGVLTD